MKICIVGMHRSGTSMTTNLLQECGMFLGSEDDIAGTVNNKSDNPEGYWENLKFIKINNKILKINGGDWKNPSKLKPGWSKNSKYNILREEAESLKKEFSDYPIWGWKDPRNTLTLEFWQSVFEDLQVVLCVRNPLEVALSFVKRKEFYIPFDQSLNLWLNYHQTLLDSHDIQTFVVTHYNSYFYNPNAELKRVTDSLGMKVADQQLEDAASTIKTGLHRNHITDAALEHIEIPNHLLEYYQMVINNAGEIYDQLLHDQDYQQNLQQTSLVNILGENINHHKKEEGTREKEERTREREEGMRERYDQLLNFDLTPVQWTVMLSKQLVTHIVLD